MTLYGLFVAICICESGMNCGAINMKTQATGPAQIRQCVLDDLNTGMKLHQMRRMDTSFYVFRLYLKRYSLFRVRPTESEARRIIQAWRNGPMSKKPASYTERVLNLWTS